MSRLINSEALLSLWRVAPQSVSFDQLPRLYSHIAMFEPDHLQTFAKHLLSRIPASPAEADHFLHVFEQLPVPIRSQPKALAMLELALQSRGERAVRVH